MTLFIGTTEQAVKSAMFQGTFTINNITPYILCHMSPFSHHRHHQITRQMSTSEQRPLVGTSFKYVLVPSHSNLVHDFIIIRTNVRKKTLGLYETMVFRRPTDCF